VPRYRKVSSAAEVPRHADRQLVVLIDVRRRRTYHAVTIDTYHNYTLTGRGRLHQPYERALEDFQ
jgi:hypothetical protein